MTKKDYIIISRCINQVVRQYPEVKAQKALMALFVYLCNELYADNPKFNSKSFWSACGMQKIDCPMRGRMSQCSDKEDCIHN